jgi:GT2 family glycosyltransferase
MTDADVPRSKSESDQLSPRPDGVDDVGARAVSPAAISARTAVVVLNWNGGIDTIDCLKSLRLYDPSVDIVLVDNASTDGSIELVEREALATEVVRVGSNRGYAGGNNHGIRAALAAGYDVIAVLNNDTIVDGPTVSGLASLVRERPELVLAPTIWLADAPGRLWFGGGVLERGWPRHLQSHELLEWPEVDGLRRCDVLTGCCIAASAAVWAETAGFDERYFLIFEDSDWSLRVRRAGFNLATATNLDLRHKVSRSFRSIRSRRLMAFYFGRNGLLFTWTHARQHLPRFAGRWLLRSLTRAVVGRERWDDVLFRWFGALCFVAGQHDAAPRSIEWLAGVTFRGAKSPEPRHRVLS